MLKVVGRTYEHFTYLICKYGHCNNVVCFGLKIKIIYNFVGTVLNSNDDLLLNIKYESGIIISGSNVNY